METTVQTRSEETGINFHQTIREAFEAAEKDVTIWKISFDVNGERVRFIRKDAGYWDYEPILKGILANY